MKPDINNAKSSPISLQGYEFSKYFKFKRPSRTQIKLIKSLLPVFVFVVGMFVVVTLVKQNQDVREKANNSFPFNEMLLDLNSEYQKSSSNVVLTEMLSIATERNIVLKNEINNDPGAFLVHAQLSEEKNSFPIEIRPYLEDSFSKSGHYISTHVDLEDGSMADTSFVKSEVGEYTQVLVKDSKIENGTYINLDGISLDSKYVATMENVEIIANPYNTDNPENSGNHQIGVFLVNWNNDPSEPVTTTQVNNLINIGNDSPTNFYYENSEGALSLTASTYGWYTLPETRPNECNDIHYWRNQVVELAELDGINVDQFEYRLFVWPSLSLICGSGGTFFDHPVGGGFPADIWITLPLSKFTYTHELGHAMDAYDDNVGHAAFFDCGTDTVYNEGRCDIIAYGDLYDVMGAGGAGNSNISNFNAPHLVEAGWKNTQTVSQDGTYTINRLTENSSPQILRIPKNDTGEYYYLSYRSNHSFDFDLPSGMTNGVSIHIWNEGPRSATKFLDSHPYTNTLEDAAMVDGQTFTDSGNSLTFTQVSHNSNSVTVNIQGVSGGNSGGYSCDPDLHQCSLNPAGGFTASQCNFYCDESNIPAYCDPWVVVCNDGTNITPEHDCSVQQSFMSTWPNWTPGGGYGRWQYEACQSHGGVSYGGCPGDINPIRSIDWCVTMDCPNGDTNGDGNCTTSDDNANTQETASTTDCSLPNSGYGDINVYADPPQGQAWESYCGTIYKNMPNNTPLSCTSTNYQPRIRVKRAYPPPNGYDLGWLSSGSYTFGSGENNFLEFQSAVFLNGTTDQLWNGPTRLTVGTTVTNYPNGNIRNIPTPWTTTTYKIAAMVDGQACQEKTITLTAPILSPTSTPTPSPSPTPPAPVAPEQFQVSSTATQATLSWSHPGATNFRVERCTGVGCTNFTQVATPSSSPYVNSGLVAGNVYRYRVRAYNGQYSPYTPIINSSVSWTINAVPVCANGVTPTVSVRMYHAAWPPNPLVWNNDNYAPGTHTLNITSTNSWNEYYIMMYGGGYTLQPTGTPPHGGIFYGQYMNPLTWMAKLNRRPDITPQLPSGTYTINYLAPESWCVRQVVFNTGSGGLSGNLGGLAGADAICQSRAQAAALPGTFKAWLSTSTVHAKDRIVDMNLGGFVMPNNQKVANNITDLLDGSLITAINRNEFGNVTSAHKYTGTQSNGNRTTNTCNNWTNASSSYNGTYGTNNTNTTWTQGGQTACSNLRNIYCFQVGN